MTRRPHLAVVLAVLLIAGCQAPIGSPGPTESAVTPEGGEQVSATETGPRPSETATPDVEREVTRTDTPTETNDERTPDGTVENGSEGEISIAVENGSLPFDAGRVFADVRRVMGADVTAPDRITVFENTSEFEDTVGFRVSPPRFQRLLGLESRQGLNGTEFERMENGVTSGIGLIYILASPDGDRSSTEWVVAHEFGHYVNLRLDRVSTLRSELGQTTDDAYVMRAIREGATVFATDAYLARHGQRSEPTAPIYERILDAVPPGEINRYGFSQYVFGYRYVADRVDDPASLDAVFENPPTTSEQVLHGYPPGAEPPATLTVTVEASETWRSGGSDRMGEAFLRYALQNGVSPDRAAAGADGWGADRLQYLRPTAGGNSSYAWVFRWDDQANATEFERTLRRYVDERGTATDGGWRLANVSAAIRTPTDRSTVLFLGDRSVTSKTTVEVRSPGAFRLVLPSGTEN